MANPGLTPVPRTATFAFFAMASIFLANARFLPTGYDNSSVVDTMATFLDSTSSICGITFLSEELVHSTATSGLPLLIAPAASLVTRTLSFLPEADHVAQVETNLGAIDIDRSDNLKTFARRHLARHCRANWTKTVEENSNRHRNLRLYDKEIRDRMSAGC